jgi:hypothetical protein
MVVDKIESKRKTLVVDYNLPGPIILFYLVIRFYVYF